MIKPHYIVILFFITTHLSIGQKNKQISEFSTLIKSIDTLNIIPAFIDIKVINLNKPISMDTTNYYLKHSISPKIHELLHEKYSIHLLDTNVDLTYDLKQDLTNLFVKLDQADQSIPDINVPDFIINIVQNEASRYCVLNYLEGKYKSEEKIKQEEKELRPKMIAVALLTLGTIYITPKNEDYCISRTIFFDKIDRRVLFYKYSTLSPNPKNDDVIKRYIYKNYRPIYYYK